ncbi:MAG: DUF1015 domain-containing protein [Planctomycetes bacterium]|nr:DUF1015 domain-containing protein [Planctomycetota bacterium]
MEIKAFRAFRFNGAVVGDSGDCIAPPYDVIDAARQQQLYEKNEYNIVRVIKGKTCDGDGETNNQYTRAAKYLDEWTEKGVLKQDSEKSIYGYVQDFAIGTENYQRSGFVSLGKLEDFGAGVKPHEQTMSNPKIDRLNLQKATGAKFGLIFMLYDDEKRIADKVIEKASRETPLVDFVDEQQVRHRLFGISDQKQIEAVKAMMKDKSCTIADGHHRYETALELYKQSGKASAQYQLFAFVNTRNEGMIVLATHRLVGNVNGFEITKLLSALKENFEVTEFKFESTEEKAASRHEVLSQIKSQQGQGGSAFGIYGGDSAFYTAVLKNKDAMKSVCGEKSQAWQSLDVSVLHKLILENELGIDEEKLFSGEYVEYVKDAAIAIDESIARVDSGEKQVAFFTNAPTIEQIEQVAAAGEKMPQKSTYFYPKVYTGLTIYKM